MQELPNRSVLTYVSPSGRNFLVRELYLPKAWAETLNGAEWIIGDAVCGCGSGPKQGPSVVDDAPGQA